MGGAAIVLLQNGCRKRRSHDPVVFATGCRDVRPLPNRVFACVVTSWAYVADRLQMEDLEVSCLFL